MIFFSLYNFEVFAHYSLQEIIFFIILSLLKADIVVYEECI